jgi:CRP-like cAMP-binding protein
MRTALSINEKTSILGTCPVFRGVPSAELATLAEMMKTEQLRKSEILFEAGELSDSVYVVASGTLNVLLPTISSPVRILGRGELLGEYAMFSSMARTATLQAATDVVLLCLDYQRFRAFLLRFPEATLVLLKTTVERLLASESRERGEGLG